MSCECTFVILAMGLAYNSWFSLNSNPSHIATQFVHGPKENETDGYKVASGEKKSREVRPTSYFLQLFTEKTHRLV